MKFTLAVTAFVGLIGRCSDFPDPPWHGHHPPPPAAEDDAGVADDPCGPPGLYADRFCKHLQPGVIPYTPRYELWSDGADKQRFVYLPEGAQIDTSNADRWTFPKDTRLYKTFSLQGRRIETRVFRKIADAPGIDSWEYASFIWDEEQRGVRVAAPDGEQNVLGTEHDVPALRDCASCHDQSRRRPEPSDIVNGFEAIQLNHDGRGWNLARLLRSDKLVNSAGAAPNVTLTNAQPPGARSEQAALGYLHANCGNCHVGTSPAAGLDLSLRLDSTEAPASALAYTAVCKPLARWTGRSNDKGEPYLLVIDPGSAATSGVIGRMDVRGAGEQMPPLGTEQIDDVGVATVSRWIDELDAPCAAPAP